MTQSFDLVIRDVRPWGGARTRIGIRDGKIAEIGAILSAKGREFDGKGKVIIPGLIDHHIHILATAAQRASIDLTNARSVEDVKQRLRNAAQHFPLGSWLRATGYDDALTGIPDRTQLDEWVPHHPLRLQDRTGALWVLNSAALAALGAPPYPDCVERDTHGVLTGRIWRGDAWLRTRLPQALPDLRALGQQLSAWGITGLTDAGAQNGADEARILSAARGSGALPQKLMLMGREDLPSPPADGTLPYLLGPIKLLLDDARLPDISTLAARIRCARALNRTVAAHCVTLAELITYLAALDEAGGAINGDRIEHGSVISADVIPLIAMAGLTVVTQPGFIAARGDRYLTEVDRIDLPDLYRLSSLMKAGVRVAASSDAPYAPPNPWLGIAAAVNRKTASGQRVSAQEALPFHAALQLYMGSFSSPGAIRQVAIGEPADLCIIDQSWEDMCANPTETSAYATLIDGVLVHSPE